MVIMLSAIFIASHQPEPVLVFEDFTFHDKLLHMGVYFILGLSIIFALHGNFTNIGKKKIIILVLLIGCTYGFSDEIHQYFIPGRDADLLDWLADIAGIALSLAALGPVKNLAIRFVTGKQVDSKGQ